MQAQRARGRLIKEIRESFTVDAFIGNATDWEKVCIGNLVGLPVIVVPTGFKNISDPPSGGSRRRTTITTGIYAPPNHDHIVCLCFIYLPNDLIMWLSFDVKAYSSPFLYV